MLAYAPHSRLVIFMPFGIEQVLAVGALSQIVLRVVLRISVDMVYYSLWPASVIKHEGDSVCVVHHLVVLNYNIIVRLYGPGSSVFFCLGFCVYVPV